MFLLNNIRDYNHKKEYPEISGVIFDIGESQLASRKNSEAWNQIKPGDIAGIIRSDHRFDNFYVVESIFQTEIERGGDKIHVVTGKRIAKMHDPISMQTLLKTRKVVHPYLNDGQFGIGFNVGNIGAGLDDVTVKTREGDLTIAQLQAKYKR